MKKNAIENIEKLINKLGLNPDVKKYFEEGKIYYLYLTAGGWIGSIDTINYDERYPKIIADCEKTCKGSPTLRLSVRRLRTM